MNDVVHEGIGVLAALSVATACLIMNSPLTPEGGIKENYSYLCESLHHPHISIEHHSGEFTVNLKYQGLFIKTEIAKIRKNSSILVTLSLSKGLQRTGFDTLRQAQGDSFDKIFFMNKPCLKYEFGDNQIVINKSGVILTARILSRGDVYMPG